MSSLDALSARLSAVRERQEAAFARHDGVAYDAAARSADDILPVMAVFASRSLGDLAVTFQEVVHSVWTVNADVAKRQ